MSEILRTGLVRAAFDGDESRETCVKRV